MAEINQFAENKLVSFDSEWLKYVTKCRLNRILVNQNLYLFKFQNWMIAHNLVKRLIDDYLAIEEEDIQNKVLKELAIFINEKGYKGWKSSAQGIDLEFNKDKTRYIVAIKSGPNWGNSSQIRKMEDDFKKAKQTIRTNNSKLNIIAVNGCCYGRNTKSDKGDYYKYCGQKFWEFISGNSDLYLKIIKPLGYSAREKNEEFQKEYSRLVNRFTAEFSKTFVKNGEIDWDALVKFNSAETK
jgi:hypothetical protein